MLDSRGQFQTTGDFRNRLELSIGWTLDRGWGIHQCRFDRRGRFQVSLPSVFPVWRELNRVFSAISRASQRSGSLCRPVRRVRAKCLQKRKSFDAKPYSIAVLPFWGCFGLVVRFSEP